MIIKDVLGNNLFFSLNYFFGKYYFNFSSIVSKQVWVIMSKTNERKNSTKDFWTISTLLIGIISIIATLIVGWPDLAQSRRSISYEKIEASPLISSQHIRSDNISISYGGKEVKTPFIVIYKITNTGLAAISKDDYSRPISIPLNEANKVLEMNARMVFDDEYQDESVIQVSRESTSTDNASSLEIASVEPVLLNPRDSIFISIIGDGVNPQKLSPPRVRIKDLTNIKPALLSGDDSCSRPFNFSRVTSLLLSIFIPLAISSIYFRLKIHEIKNQFLQRFFIFNFICFILFWAFTGIAYMF